MCTYFFHLYTCGCAHIDLKRTLLAHCLAVNKAVACWHIQVKYRTLEVNCPGTTLPQPRPCPLVLTREQLEQAETLTQRNLREDLIKKVAGSFNGNVELQRCIKEDLDQDLEASKERARQVETKQWARGGRYKPAITRLSKTDFTKNPSARNQKEGNPINLEYPPGYLAHIQRLEFHQQRLDLSPNTIIEDIAYGCGRKSDPSCLSGHIREGKSLCPWLIAQRLKGEPEDPEEFAILRDTKCRGGAKLDLDNPSESEFIRSTIICPIRSARTTQVAAAQKEGSVGYNCPSDLPATEFPPSNIGDRSPEWSAASRSRPFPLHFEYGTHARFQQENPCGGSKGIGVATSPSSTVRDAPYDAHAIEFNPEAHAFRPGARVHKKDMPTKTVIETRNLSDANYLEIQQIVPRNPQLSTGDFVHWQGEALWGTGVQWPSTAPINTVIFPAGTNFLHFDTRTSKRKASSGPLTQAVNSGTQLQSATHSSTPAKSKSMDMHNDATNRSYLGVALPYHCQLVPRDMNQRTLMPYANYMQVTDRPYHSPGRDGRFISSHRGDRGRTRGRANVWRQTKGKLPYSGLVDTRTNKVTSLATFPSGNHIQRTVKAITSTTEQSHAASLASTQASAESTRRASSVPSSPPATNARCLSCPPVFGRAQIR